MTDIVTNTTTGIVLATGSFTNPVSVASTASVSNTLDEAVLGTQQAWTVTNSGTITGIGGDGVHLTEGGYLSQTSAGTISGSVGVSLDDAATLVIHGTIVGTGGTAVAFGGTAVAFGGSAAVNNTLSIYADTVLDGIAVGAPDADTNVLHLASDSSAGTISGLGVSFSGFGIIRQDAGATWDVVGFNTIDPGVLVSGSSGMAISGNMTNGGVFESGATLQANTYLLNLASGTVLQGTGASVFGLDVGDVLVNQGTVSASGNMGVDLALGGLVTNATGALITGKYDAVYFGSGVGTVVNGGTIASNGSGGAYDAGIYLGGGGTVVNAGSISGFNGTAVAFGGTLANLLVIDPGAGFNGVAIGGASAASNAIELTAGGSPGTIAAVGTSFAGFSTINVDPGAYWAFTDSGSIDAAATLTVFGNLTNFGTLTGVASLAASAVFANASAATLSSMTSAVVGTGINVSVSNSGSIVATGSSYAIDLAFGGTVSNYGAAAISGHGGIHGAGAITTVANSGAITGVSASRGVYLAAGGYITNASSAVISGDVGGVLVNGGLATVQNQGTISATNTTAGYALVLGAAGVVNNGTSGLVDGFGGIDLGSSGATLFNSGTVAGSNALAVSAASGAFLANAADGTISAVGRAVRLDSGSTLVNAGTISSMGSLSVYLGGTAANLLVVDPGAVFAGGVSGALAAANVMELAYGASEGTISGIGSSFANFATIEVDAGAQWAVVTTDNTIANATIVNSGTIFGAVTLGIGGYLTNEAAGLISSTTGAVDALGSGASVTNSGTITTTNFDGVALRSGGTVENSGLIATDDLAGVYLGAGGFVSNTSAGTIAGHVHGIYFRTGVGTVINGGSITASGTASGGIVLAGGGYVSNATTGQINGAAVGVLFTFGAGSLVNAGTIVGSIAGAGALGEATVINQDGALIEGGTVGIAFVFGGNTVVNAGTIIGGGDTAVAFRGSAPNLMVMDPGSYLTGIVEASTSGLDTLELASASAAGTIDGLGVSYINFGTITVDPGADWTASGYGTIAAGTQLIDDGSFTVADTLTNSGLISGGVAVQSGGMLSNTVSGTISYDAVAVLAVAAGATVVNAGLVTAGSYGIVLGYGGSVVNDASGVVVGQEIGIFLVDSGSILNSGVIRTADTASLSAAAVGALRNAYITNTSSGYISGGIGVDTYWEGTDTLVNAGTIVGTSGTAVVLDGVLGNLLVVDPGAVFVGNVVAALTATNALELAAGSAPGTLSGLGSSFSGFATITVDASANWTLAGDNAVGSSATISDFGTLTNAGTLDATVTLEAGSYLLNGAGATIATAGSAVVSTLANVGLVNGGVLASSGQYGVELGSSGSGIVSVTNQTGGLISGTGGVQLGTIGVQTLTGATVANYGTIVGTTGPGVYILGAGTLINGGTIIGANGTAAVLGGTGANLLVLDPGAAFTGVVLGYGLALNTMELTGGGQGTVSGLGVSFEDFEFVTIDSAASWTVEGSNTIAAAYTFSVDGVLTNSGTIDGLVTLDLDGTVTNASGGTIVGITEAILGTGPGASVVNAGTIVGAQVAVSLASGGQVTNQSTGLIRSESDSGIKATVASALVVNEGTVTAANAGVYLMGGGSVQNASGATVIGGTRGVKISGGAGTVVNAGSIAGLGTGFYAVGIVGDDALISNASSGRLAGISAGIYVAGMNATITNAGTVVSPGYGILVSGSGTVDNAFGAMISASSFGVSVGNGSTVTNAGTIVATSGTAVSFDDMAGTAWLALRPGAVFEGLVVASYSATNVMELADTGSGPANPSVGTVSGLGLAFRNFETITVDAGARWSVAGFNTVGSSVLLATYGDLDVTGTLNNDGSIIGENTLGSAVTVSSAGTLTNNSSITGGVSLLAGSLVNDAGGTVSGYPFGVYGGGDLVSTVINDGSITGTVDGVYLSAGGLVFNGADGLIDGSRVGVLVSGATGTIVNAGTISDSFVAGVLLRAGGVVGNVGLISGIIGVGASNGAATVVNAGTILGTANTGVALFAGGTVVNTGTISGNNGTAVAFNGSVHNRLVVDPGAVFVGAAVGSVDAGADNALELASAASAGTLTGIGASFTDFGLAEVDAGARWTLSDTNSMASGSTLAVFGTLTNTGTLQAQVTIETGGYLSNIAGATIISPGIAVLGEAQGLDVVNHGTVASLANDAGDYAIMLQAGGTVTNTEDASVAGGAIGIQIAGGVGTVMNSGTIGGSRDAVHLATGGQVTNATIGFIGANSTGVLIEGGAGTVTNAGTIAGESYGVDVRIGGTVVNTAGALIRGGNDAVEVAGGVGTVVNSGTVTAGYDGVFAVGGGSVTNNSGAVIAGGYSGVYIRGGDATVLNSGIISGSGYYGVYIDMSSSPAATALVINSASASISGYYNGVYIKFGPASVVNAGNIVAIAAPSPGVSVYGVDLDDGGGLTNTASGRITGYGGVYLRAGAIEMLNEGTIVGTGYRGLQALDAPLVVNSAGARIEGGTVGASFAGGTLTNAGTIVSRGTDAGDYAVVFAAGGTITNTSGASIAGGVIGVEVAGGAGTVANSGAVTGALDAIHLADGGQVTNAASASIHSDGNGVLIEGGAGLVTNAGDITGTSAFGVGIDLGGTVINQAGGRIEGGPDGVYVAGGSGVVVNDGTLTGADYGVYALQGASVTNSAGAVISGGYDGVHIKGVDATVLNSGVIAGSNYYGVYVDLTSAGGGALVVNAASASISGYYDGVDVKAGLATVTNAGDISATGGGAPEYYGVALGAGGSVTNAASGRITGYGGIRLGSGPTDVMNEGTIIGTGYNGILSTQATRIVNAAGGRIEGYTVGVSLADGTVVNAGTVVGLSGTAVAFTGSAFSLVVIDPGAVFDGVVTGGISSTNAMELTSAAGSGTLDGLGTSYTNFGTVTVDSGARWTLGGSGNTLAQGSTLANDGMLTLQDAVLSDSGTIDNNGLIALDPSRLNVWSLTGTGVVSIGAGSTLDVYRGASAGQTLQFTGGDGAFLILDDAPDAAATIGGFAFGDTIDLTNLHFAAGQTAANVAGNVLSVTNGTLTFTFPTASLADGTALYTVDDGDGGTDITFTPTSPGAMGLAVASDSGVHGDDLTRVTLPTIVGHAAAFGTIDLYLDSVLVGVGTADGSGDWSVATTVAMVQGLNTFTSTVTDPAGHLSDVSAPFMVTLDVEPPAAPTDLLLAPPSDSNVAGDDITNLPLPVITGMAAAYSTIDLYDGATLIGVGTADGSGQWSVTATTSLTAGANVLTAHALDEAGNDSGASATLAVTYLMAAVTPVSLALAPASDTGIPGDRLTNLAIPALVGNGTPGNTIDLYDAGTLVGTGTVDVSGHWSVTVTTPLAEGANTLTVKAIDAAGNTSEPSSPLVVTLDTTFPAIPGNLALAEVSDSGRKGDDITAVATPTITGTGTPGDAITLYDGETAVATGTVALDGTWTVTPTTPLSDGTHLLRALQTSPAGNVSAPSSALTLSIDTTLPPSPGTLVLAAPSDTGVLGDDRTSILQPTILGSGAPGDVVTVYDGDVVIGTATISDAGTWAVVPTAALSDGTHPLSARVASAAGNQSAPSATLPLTIDTMAPPTPTLTQTASVTDPAKPNLVGSAQAGATVTIYDGATALGSAIADDSGHFTFVVPAALSSGAHMLMATAADAAGNVSPRSAPLTVNVDADSGYAIVSPADDSGTTVSRSYSNTGTFTAANTYDGGGLLLQHVTANVTIRNIYDSDGTLIGIVSGPGSDDGTPPQPDFATARQVQGAQTATDSGASVVTLLAESNNLSTKGNDTIFAGSGSTTVSANANSVLVAGGTGSLVFAGGSASSTVLGGAGSSLIFGGPGGGIFQGGSAGHNVLVAGDGNATLLGGGAGDLLLGAGSGEQLIMGSASRQTLVGGGSAATLVGGGSGQSELFGGPGDSEIFASSGGADTIVSGSGSAVVAARQGDVVFASQGAATVFGSAIGDDVVVGGGAMLVVGGNGNDLYAGSSGASTVFAGAGNDTLFTGSGNMLAVLGGGQDQVFLGSGAATVFAGSGKDIFAAFAGTGGGRTVIAGFKVGTDLVALGGYDPAAVTQRSGDAGTTLTLSDDTQITLLGINHLDASSIV